MKKNHLVLACLVILFSGAAQAATVGRTILNSGATLALYNPVAATDAQGNIHLALQGMDATAPSTGVEDIYYMMLSGGGTVLIGASKINTDANGSHGRPRIAVTSDNKVVIVWAGGGKAVTIAEIDPALDTSKDGGALAPAAIVRAATAVGTNTSSGHYAMVLDHNNIAHIVMNRSSTLYYIGVNPATAVVVNPEVSLAQSVGSRRVDPGLGVDSANKLHVVFASSTLNGDAPAAYMMLSNTGTVLIAPTALYDATVLHPHAAHFSLFLDSGDIVHVVYGDKRNTLDADNWCNTDCSQGGTMVYTRLDPSNDPQDGTASDMATLRVGEEAELNNNWYTRAFLRGSTLHLFGGSHSGGDILYSSIGLGGSKASGTRLIDANVATPGWSRKYVAMGGSKVFWGEAVFSPTLVGGTTQLVMASLGSFDGGGGGGGAPSPILLAVFGLAGLARALRKRL